MSVFEPVSHARTAEEIAHQIESLILEGVLRSGDRLPAERDLAQEMAVSRPILREATKALEDKHILERRHGGGTFVADVIGTVFSPQISSLLGSHQKVTEDFLEYRREIEGVAARMAAERATPSDRALLVALAERMEQAHHQRDFEAEARVDVEFHTLIGEMAHNLVMLHMLRACYRLLSEGVFRNRHQLYTLPGGRDALFGQHMAIYKAILAADGKAAERAAREHIDYVIEQTRELAQTADRERISKLRLTQRGPRAMLREGGKRRAGGKG